MEVDNNHLSNMKAIVLQALSRAV